MNNNSQADKTHRVESANLSDPGRKRKNNEDFVASYEPTDLKQLQESGSLYIVADGVGGAARGERVSEYAAGKVLYEYFQHSEIKPGERLRQIMNQVNEEIYAFAEQNDTRMATTMVAAVVRENLLTVANVGDSRAYLIHAGEAQQITNDHSIVGELIRNGSMTEAEAQQSKAKNRLSRSLGGEPKVHVDVFPDIPLQPGDKILLCSDGLTRYTLRENISRMTSQGSAKEIAEELVDFAKESGGGDNVSVIVVAFEPSGSTAPALHVQQPLQQPTSWEDMLTEQPAILRRPLRHGISIPRKYVPYVILGLSIFLVAGITVSALFIHLPVLQANSTMSVAPMEVTTTPVNGTPATETIPPETATAQALAAPQLTGTPTPATPMAGLPIDGVASPTSTSVEAATATAIPALSPSPTLEGFLPSATPVVGVCKCTVTKGTTLWGLATSWAGIDASNKAALDVFYHAVSCAPAPNGNCIKPTPPWTIYPDWVLLLPNIPAQTCSNNGGIPQ